MRFIQHDLGFRRGGETVEIMLSGNAANPARVQRILEGAGFREVSLTPVNLDYQLAGAGGAAEAA